MVYQIVENVLYIFTDWASRPALNKVPKRVGGMGIFFVYVADDGYIKYEDMSDYVGYVWSTNNDMELLASIGWLKLACEKECLWFSKIIVVSDSQFVVDNSP